MTVLTKNRSFLIDPGVTKTRPHPTGVGRNREQKRGCCGGGITVRACVGAVARTEAPAGAR